MSQQAQVRNPFMLLVNPGVVLAAIENSAHLNKLNSKLCRPLDGPTSATTVDDTDGEVQAEAEVADVVG